MPMEKIRMPSSASISTTPDCDLAMRIESSATPWVGGIRRIDRRITHAYRAPGVDGNPQAAHRLVARQRLAAAIVRIGNVDRGQAADRGAAQAIEGDAGSTGGRNHRIRRTFRAGAL